MYYIHVYFLIHSPQVFMFSHLPLLIRMLLHFKITFIVSLKLRELNMNKHNNPDKKYLFFLMETSYKFYSHSLYYSIFPSE